MPSTLIRSATCAHCHRSFVARWDHGHWQQYCSIPCARRARPYGKMEAVKRTYGLADDAALRTWLLDHLNRRPVTVVADLCGVQKQALYHWMRILGIRKVLRYEVDPHGPRTGRDDTGCRCD